ncbi:hypothetical protein A2U01_0084669, partial [Trifolium medium]|nr:hypothetical protein [Trifolium medium]
PEGSRLAMVFSVGDVFVLLQFDSVPLWFWVGV